MSAIGAALASRIDDETLRDSPLDPGAAAAAFEELLASDEPPTPAGAMARHIAIGNAARLLLRLDLAEQHQAAALRLATEHGTPRQAVLARTRYAHVLQWQRRFAEATAEFTRCLDEAGAAGDAAHFVYQHAGKCWFDAGDWDRAAELFGHALRLRSELGDAGLVASSRQAASAAAACSVAATVGAELHRLVPAVHAAARPVGAPLLRPLAPHGWLLVDVRTLLLAGPAPLAAVRAVHRYQPTVDDALAALAAGGWLVRRDDMVLATDRCLDLLRSLMAGLDEVCTTLWASPDALLASATTAVGAAASDLGPAGAFDALAAAGHPGGGSTAGRLFTALCALRYHRADAHAAARAAEGLSHDEEASRWVEAATDRGAARPFRALPDPAGFVGALRALDGRPG